MNMHLQLKILSSEFWSCVFFMRFFHVIFPQLFGASLLIEGEKFLSLIRKRTTLNDCQSVSRFWDFYGPISVDMRFLGSGCIGWEVRWSSGAVILHGRRHWGGHCKGWEDRQGICILVQLLPLVHFFIFFPTSDNGENNLGDAGDAQPRDGFPLYRPEWFRISFCCPSVQCYGRLCERKWSLNQCLGLGRLLSSISARENWGRHPGRVHCFWFLEYQIWCSKFILIFSCLMPCTWAESTELSGARTWWWEVHSVRSRGFDGIYKK